MTSTIYLNGAFVDEAEAKVSVFDGGWLHGAGLFEAMRAENGRVFRLEAHLGRLRDSASQLLTPLERETLPTASVFAELLRRNSLKAGRVRLTVSAGSMREDLGNSQPQFTVCATATGLFPYPPDFYEKGVRVVVCPFRTSPNDPLAGHQTTGYLPRLLGLRRAQEARCVEALWFTTENRLAEGCISNVFLVRAGVLETPPLDTPVLPGIARSIVLEIARNSGIQVHEWPVSIDELLDADEVLLTNAIMQVMPVIGVERHNIRDARVGPMTRALLEGYRDLVKAECIP